MNARADREKDSSSSYKTVLAIDPGRLKCGVAVVSATNSHAAYQAVIETISLSEVIAELEQRFHPDIIVIGDGTTSAQAAQVIDRISELPVQFIDEKYTSLMARKKYFEQNPPRGLRKFIPLSMQTPDKPIDDYVAVILAEMYLGRLEL